MPSAKGFDFHNPILRPYLLKLNHNNHQTHTLTDTLAPPMLVPKLPRLLPTSEALPCSLICPKAKSQWNGRIRYYICSDGIPPTMHLAQLPTASATKCAVAPALDVSEQTIPGSSVIILAVPRPLHCPLLRRPLRRRQR